MGKFYHIHLSSKYRGLLQNKCLCATRITMLKLIENNHYHIWTDALHVRELAYEYF